MLNILKNTINRVFASGVDSDASAFITATGLSGTTQKSAITTLVKDLKASGLWSKMKAVYPMVTDIRNFTSYSEDFSDGSWTKGNSTITTNSTTAPNGTLTADSLVENTLNATHLVSNTTAITTTANDHTLSVYAKKANRDWLYLNLYNGTTSLFAWFNLNTGAVGTVQSGLTAAIQDVGNGWYRLSVTRTLPSTVNCFIQYGSASADNTTTFVGNGLVAAYLWGAQLELGSTASAYQPILTTPSAYMASQMKYNLKDARDLDAAFRLTWSGGWTYSATGATPNGTNAYADTKLIPSGLTAQNSLHISAYSRTDIAQNSVIIGGYDGVVETSLYPRFTGNVIYSAINSNTSASPGSSTSSLGNFIATRLISTQEVTFINANKLTRNQSSLNNLTRAIFIGAMNYLGSANVFSSRQLSFSTIGDGLTDQDASLLNQIVEKYQVALSRGVQAAQSFYYNSAYSNEANTYLYSTQITGTTQVSAINTLINGLKANNLWAKMKAVYPFVTDYRNLLGYTENFTDAYWTKLGSTITANTIIAPNGTLTADTLQENTLNTEHHVKTTLNGLIPSETYTYSNYVKYNDRRYILIAVYWSASPYPAYIATFDILNGVFVSQSGNSGGTIIGSSITSANNGWYRISVSGNLGAVTNNVIVQINLLDDSLSQSYLGTSKSTYIWGAQFELGSSATPYQPVLAANSSSTFMSSQMKFNLVNPQDSDAAFRLAFSGGWTYSTNGAQPNGTNGYADTKLNLASIGVSAASNHISVYLRTNSDGVYCDIGAYNIASDYQISTYAKISNVAYVDLGVQAANRITYANTDSTGYYLASRTASNILKAFKNNILKATNTNTNTASILSRNIYISANNDVSGVTQFSNRQNAFTSIGDGLSDAEAALLYQLIQQYQTDLSRQV